MICVIISKSLPAFFIKFSLKISSFIIQLLLSIITNFLLFKFLNSIPSAFIQSASRPQN